MFPVLTAWVGAGCIKTSEKNGKGCKLLTLSLPSYFFFSQFVRADIFQTNSQIQRGTTML